MAENVITASALIDVSDRSENGVPENEVPGTEVPENNVISGSDTAEAQNEPEWFRDGGKWVKIFLEPDGAVRAGDVAPGKFKQHDYVYSVPGENEFPKERWSSAECIDGFHITRRRDVWYHLPLHDYKSAYIAEVVSHGDEFYDTPRQRKRKVRVVTFGPAAPLADVLGKHPSDFKNDRMLVWSAANNHLELLKLVVSRGARGEYVYSMAFALALKNGNDQIAVFLFEKYENEMERRNMLYGAIACGRADMVKRMMENTSVDVGFFRVACAYGQFKIFQLLCDKYGEPKCSEIINSALRGGNVDILNYIKSRGVDMTDFGMFAFVSS
jgi:hypothetical protein